MNPLSPIKEPLIDQVLNVEEAIKYFKQLIQDPERVSTEVQNGNLLQLALKITPEQMLELYNTGHQLFESEEYENAAHHFMCLALFDSGEPSYLLSYAHTCYVLQNYEDALKAFQASAELESQNPEPHYYASHCLFKLGRDQEALEAYIKAIDLAKQDFAYHELEELATLEKAELERMMSE